jgi:hypothetical protein
VRNATSISTLDEILDRVFEQSDDRGWTWAELARRSSLSYACIWHHGWRRRQTCRLSTAFALIDAVGMTLTVTEQRRLRAHRA